MVNGGASRKSSRIDDGQRRLSHYSMPAFQAGIDRMESLSYAA
jgi:hypothetical protein